MPYITDSIVDEIYEEVLKRIKQIYNKNLNSFKPKIVVFGNKNETLINKFDILEFEKTDINSIDYIFITELSCKMLVSLATLMCLSKEEQFILKALSIGKKIYVLKNNIEYKSYIKTLPKEIYKKYFQYESILKDFNIKFIDKIDINDTKKNLISLNNVKEIIQDNKVVLGKNDIISPLVKDFLNDNNIKIERS
nr:hypothetical protein [uncultured Tyzzerella sp.]